MTHIMIVAKDTLGTINTHVISGIFKINKNQNNKNVHIENNFKK